MAACFVIPATEAFVSGGNIYNNALIGALAKTIPIQRMDWDSFTVDQDSDNRNIFDTLYLDFFEKENIAIPDRSFLLLHYLDVFYEQQNNHSLLAKRMQQLQQFERLIATGSYSKEWLIEKGIAEEKIILIEPFITAFRRKSPVVFNKKNILLIGNLVKVKGYADFLNELNIQQPSNISVTILGDSTIDTTCSGNIHHQIKQAAYLTQIVCLKKTVPHHKVMEYFEESNLFVSASLFETFGMAVHEALQFGLPVYALANGNLRTIKHPLLSLFHNNTDLMDAIKSFNPETVFAIKKEEENNYSWEEAACKLRIYLPD